MTINYLPNSGTRVLSERRSDYNDLNINRLEMPTLRDFGDNVAYNVGIGSLKFRDNCYLVDIKRVFDPKNENHRMSPIDDVSLVVERNGTEYNVLGYIGHDFAYNPHIKVHKIDDEEKKVLLENILSKASSQGMF